MATKRDLVEAHSFNRRRLVTAFLSGAPGGREVEPVRHGRTIIGGAVLATLIVAGAAVMGFLKPAAGDDWKSDSLIITKSGGRFINQDGSVYQVANTVSARLILNLEGEMVTTQVPDDLFVKEGVQVGPPIGITGAPDLLPAPDALIQTGWVSCTNTEGGTKVSVATTAPATAASGAGLVVTSRDDGSRWLVVGERRYKLPRDDAALATIRTLGLDGQRETTVGREWLNLIPQGTALADLAVPGSGTRSTAGAGGLDLIGTPVRFQDSRYILTDDGLLSVSPFAYAVYRASAAGAAFQEVELTADTLAQIATSRASIVPSDWPDFEPEPFTGSAPCVMLRPGADDESVSAVNLAVPEDAALAVGTNVSATVEAGHGAVVRVTSTSRIDDTTPVVFIDQIGIRYAIEGRYGPDAPLRALGYDEVEPVGVPQSWTALFADGPVLSPQEAIKVVRQ